MHSLKIILLAVAAAIVYGILHDLFTVHLCLEYFTKFHPPILYRPETSVTGVRGHR